MKIKVLSLTQPWATLAAIGAKKIETRSWPTSYRGPLAIHASKGFPKWAREYVADPAFRAALGAITLEDLPLGAIIATADLVDVQRITETNRPPEPELSFGDYSTPGRFAWHLANVRRLAIPIPARGALGLWEFDLPGIVRYEPTL